MVVFLAIITFVSSFGLTNVMKRVAVRLNIVDRPNTSLKTHEKATPYLGGGAILGSVMLGLLLSLLFGYTTLRETLSAGILALVISGMGLIDDCYAITWKIRICIQFLVGIYLYFFGLSIQILSFPVANFLITVIWVAAVINSINIIDIMDGLSSGVAAISGLGFGLLGMIYGVGILKILGFSLAGASTGFLIHNFKPATIFLGDMGSTFIGLILALSSVILIKSQGSTVVSAFSALLLLFVPLFDLTFVCIIRILNKKSPFRGSPDHFAIRLRNYGLAVEHVVCLAYCVQSVFVALAILLCKRPGLLPYIAVFMIMSALIFAIVLLRLPKLHTSKRRTRSRF